jgi:hypothetical protein
MWSILFFLLLCRIFQSYMPFLRETYISRKCLQMQTSIRYSEDEDENKRNKKKQWHEHIPLNHDNQPLYTLIWYDCEQCKKLLNDMEDLCLKNVYINGGSYFYDIEDVDSKFNTPLMYKEDIFIGDNLFDIYAEIYRGI